MAKREPKRTGRSPKGAASSKPGKKKREPGERAWMLPSDDPGEKRKRGRPRLIATPEEFWERLDAYLDSCATIDEPITMTGMALALGFASRQTLFSYGKDPRFSLPVKTAKLIVEYEYELDLRRKGGSGAIFGLKNFGWIDERTMRVVDDDGAPVRFADMSDEELVEQAAKLTNRVGVLTLVAGGRGNGKKKNGANGNGNGTGGAAQTA